MTFWDEPEGPTDDELYAIELEEYLFELREWYAVQYPQIPDPPPFDWGDSDECWRSQAACRGQGRTPETIEPWFPPKGGRQKAQEGIKWCRHCEVRGECGEFADRNNITWGVYGGQIRHREKDQNNDSIHSHDDHLD